MTVERAVATAPDPAGTADGAQLADRLTGLAAALAPGQRPDDIALIETLVQVISYEDFNAVIQP